ncbi:hypothetical protein AAFF_G00023470 [Aldrovandia affinis]|uniref:Uncharacterized protein n=1 Tax=Aldrovandia affinis TaxID=143900 RepID=A0AAD7X0E8_9TELE|nr:hypothetical protein AAFF_G00023470 [Aldrovandia affinis]
MEDNLQGSEIQAYVYQHMRSKLKEHFGDRLIETNINGKPNVVTFRSTAKAILQDFYAHRETDPETEKKRIIETAAKLIKDDIKSVETSHEVYPDCDSLKSEEDANNFLPESLRVLLKGLLVGKNIGMKTASIGQAIMQATRPKVILAPLQIGLGVQLHHHFASRFLIDTLHQLGFCYSFAGDNVDHNIRTLDGNNTFHGMGMIAAITPATKSSNPILRAKVTRSDMSMVGRVPILFHREESRGTTAVTYQKLVTMTAQNPTADLDLIWKTAILFASPRPAWSGMMQFVQHGTHPGKSSFVFLPMIDMSPSDATCIYSTLKFLCEHAHRHNAIPIITFDQPLWWKALLIIEAEPEGSDLSNIVLRLGGFHTEISFLGSIGHLMAGTGLQEVMELVYAVNAVVHMMTGKAIARAVRAHLLIDGVLNGLILSDALGVALPLQPGETEDVAPPLQPGEAEDVAPPLQPGETEECDAQMSSEENTPAGAGTVNSDLDEVAVLDAQLMEGSVSAEKACNADVMLRIKELLKRKTESLKSSSRTAALWLQYMDMVDILRKFLRAECIGNWALHLEAISEMLPFMAASGHNLYTKSAWIYVQRMCKLQVDHPDVYKRFGEGFHVVRRSDRVWAGLSVDLVIEPVLMRSMKTSGGLTRGRGMTELQRLKWLLSMPACAEVNNAMQELTG